MDLPPHTPRQLFKALASKPDVRAHIARGWILVGTLVLLFTCAMAIAHYAYGMPIRDRDTGQLSAPANSLMMFLLIGGGGAFFVVMGVLLYRWNPDRSNDP